MKKVFIPIYLGRCLDSYKLHTYFMNTLILTSIRLVKHSIVKSTLAYPDFDQNHYNNLLSFDLIRTDPSRPSIGYRPSYPRF